MKRTLSPLTILASFILLTVFPYGAAQTQTQKEPTFVVKGNLIVSGPLRKLQRRKTIAGYRYSGTAVAKPSLDRLEFEGTLRGQPLDPKSKAIRNAVEQAIQSANWTLDDNSTVVEAQERARARVGDTEKVNLPDVKAWARSTVRKPAVSFNFSGQGTTKLSAADAETTGFHLAAGDQGSGEGLITNFRTTVPELKALNGARILVKANYRVDQIDASGVARGRIEFELRSEK